MIQFAQFIRPNGRRQNVGIERPAPIEAMAEELVRLGWRFEAEIIFKSVHFEATRKDDEDHVISSSRLVQNGPAVLVAVDELITEVWLKRSSPIPTEEEDAL